MTERRKGILNRRHKRRLGDGSRYNRCGFINIITETSLFLTMFVKK